MQPDPLRWNSIFMIPKLTFLNSLANTGTICNTCTHTVQNTPEWKRWATSNFLLLWFPSGCFIWIITASCYYRHYIRMSSSFKCDLRNDIFIDVTKKRTYRKQTTIKHSLFFCLPPALLLFCCGLKPTYRRGKLQNLNCNIVHLMNSQVYCV